MKVLSIHKNVSVIILLHKQHFLNKTGMSDERGRSYDDGHAEAERAHTRSHTDLYNSSCGGRGVVSEYNM